MKRRSLVALAMGMALGAAMPLAAFAQADYPNVLVVHPGTPFKTVKDVVDYAKANPGKLDYGFTHAASGHMAMELFKQTPAFT